MLQYLMGVFIVSEAAQRIISEGKINVRVKRSGMYQVLTFKIRRVKAGQDEFVELFVDRILDMSELLRVANEFGLPVESQNGRAFPDGLGVKDFLGL